MGYGAELRGNIRSLAAASLGTGSGLMLMSYVSTIFAPFLVKEFAWSRAQYALIGLTMVSTLAALPFIGRLTDRYGVRRSAIVGALGIPACLVAYSFMTGSFAVYFAISCMILALGSFTSPVVYTRVIASDFQKARGLALTIVTISPALLGALAAPVLTEIISSWGWRAGYRVLAAFILVSSLCAIALVPGKHRQPNVVTKVLPAAARTDFGLIVRSKAFWIILGAMFLCTLSTPLHASQMGLMLSEHRLDSAQVALMISVYGVGTVVGRLTCGVALDKFSAPVVSAISMVLPAFGFALLGSALDGVAVVAFAMFLVGLAVGAEGDLQSFLVARQFDLRIFSTTLSLVYCGVFAASAIGAVLLSVTLKFTGSFDMFLMMMVVAIALGSGLFAFLPRRDPDKVGEAAGSDSGRAAPVGNPVGSYSQ